MSRTSRTARAPASRRPTELPRRLADAVAGAARPLHATRAWRALAHGEVSARGLAQLLAAYRPLHAALEHALVVGRDPLVAVAAVPWVSRTARIDADLAELAARGAAPAPVPASEAIRGVEALATQGDGALLGACFVAEHAAVAGRPVALRLGARLGVTIRSLDVHGAEAEARLAAFRRRLVAHAPPGADDGIVAGAVTTLRALHQVLEGVSRPLLRAATALERAPAGAPPVLT